MPSFDARDLGTQFEVRVTETSLRVRVRSGAVELTSADRMVAARAGSEVLISPSGIETRPVAISGEQLPTES